MLIMNYWRPPHAFLTREQKVAVVPCDRNSCVNERPLGRMHILEGAKIPNGLTAPDKNSMPEFVRMCCAKCAVLIAEGGGRC